MVHPGIGEEAPLEILDILEQAGADISHTAIAHMDRTVLRDENILGLARRGCYIEYDLFGTECSHYQVRFAMCKYQYSKSCRCCTLHFDVCAQPPQSHV